MVFTRRCVQISVKITELKIVKILILPFFPLSCIKSLMLRQITNKGIEFITRYKNSEERGPLNEAMNMLLPMIYQRCAQLVHDPSEVSALLQKQILKIFFALIQYFLPLNLITRDIFSQWMELLRNIVDRPIPQVQIFCF